jgi:hypothetical protein
VNEGTSLWDIFKDALLPSLTFAAGYLLSTWDKTRESRRQVHNMRTILFKELEDNYSRVDSLWPPSNDLGEVAKDAARIDILARRSLEFSFSVYDQYLGQMSSLKADELDKVFDAYHMMRQANAAGAAFVATVSGPRESRNREKEASLASAFLFTIDAALSKMSDALDVFPSHQREAKELKSRRGSEIQRFNEMSQAFGQALDEKQTVQEHTSS